MKTDIDLKNLLLKQINKSPKNETLGIAIVVGIILIVFGVPISAATFLAVSPLIGSLLTLIILFLIGIVVFVLFIFATMGTYNVYANDNERFNRYLADPELMSDWNESKVQVYKEDKYGTSVWKTKNYLCVNEDLIQGPFFIRFTNLENVEISFRDLYKGLMSRSKYTLNYDGLEIGCTFTERGRKPLTLLLYLEKKEFPTLYEHDVYKCLQYVYSLNPKPKFVFEKLGNKEKLVKELVVKLQTR